MRAAPWFYPGEKRALSVPAGESLSNALYSAYERGSRRRRVSAERPEALRGSQARFFRTPGLDVRGFARDEQRVAVALLNAVDLAEGIREVERVANQFLLRFAHAIKQGGLPDTG